METLTTAELLERLNFDMSEYAILTDDDSSYLIICLKNLTEEHKIILNELNFDNVKDTLFVSLNESFTENEVIKFLSNEYVSKEEKLWEDVLKKIQYVNEIYIKFKSEPLFNHTYGHILMPFHWKGKITLNDHDFHIFLEDINKFFRESCTDNEFAKRHKFWRIIQYLRNEQDHDSTNDKIKNQKKNINRKFDSFNFLIDKDIPEYEIDFVKAQIRILECFIEYLDFINGELNVFNR
jgi:hypothetical protein